MRDRKRIVISVVVAAVLVVAVCAAWYARHGVVPAGESTISSEYENVQDTAAPDNSVDAETTGDAAESETADEVTEPVVGGEIDVLEDDEVSTDDYSDVTEEDVSLPIMP